jgi:hypothetical protein
MVHNASQPARLGPMISHIHVQLSAKIQVEAMGRWGNRARRLCGALMAKSTTFHQFSARSSGTQAVSEPMPTA